MIFHPLQEIAIGSKCLAMGKYLSQAISGVSDQIGDKVISIPVTISQKGQRRDSGRWRDSVLSDVIQGWVGKNNESCEM